MVRQNRSLFTSHLDLAPTPEAVDAGSAYLNAILHAWSISNTSTKELEQWIKVELDKIPAQVSELGLIGKQRVECVTVRVAMTKDALNLMVSLRTEGHAKKRALRPALKIWKI